MLLRFGLGSGTRAQQTPANPESAEQSAHALPTFEEVYDRCFPFVWRTSRRLGVPEEALDDVCQEVFLVVHRRLASFEGRAKIETWIYRIIANTARNQRRTSRRRSPHERSASSVLEPDEVAAPLPGPEVTAQRNEAVGLAREILMALPEPQRLAFALVDLEGMSYQEAAESLGESIHTIRARTRAARAEFARLSRRYQSRARWRSSG